FSDFRTVETGIKHGTLTVLADGEPYEVTTYRVDGEYEDHRHPKSVEFTDSLAGDLARRDFTINAICYSERDGFVDMFSGIEDIKNKIIRAVGDPARRFEEDALRILRAVRFSAVLGFEIEENTRKWAIEKAPLLAAVSPERIYVELKKLMGGKYAYPILENYTEILSRFLLSTIRLPKREKFDTASFEVRLFSLFALSSDDPSLAFVDFCDRMRTDSRIKKLGKAVLENIDIPLLSRSQILLAIASLSQEAVRLICEVRRVICIENTPTCAEIDEILSLGYPLSLASLNVGGEDMKAIGFSGREIGEALETLLKLVLSDKVINERDALVLMAQKIKNGI
ncbi:MAG: polynucleotide adenylyltransferase, partial [Clostridia bacterium]|nr:polynucleotide adenylyltransferase [Clostridia bacterium]